MRNHREPTAKTHHVRVSVPGPLEKRSPLQASRRVKLSQRAPAVAEPFPNSRESEPAGSSKGSQRGPCVGLEHTSRIGGRKRATPRADANLVRVVMPRPRPDDPSHRHAPERRPPPNTTDIGPREPVPSGAAIRTKSPVRDPPVNARGGNPAELRNRRRAENAPRSRVRSHPPLHLRAALRQTPAPCVRPRRRYAGSP